MQIGAGKTNQSSELVGFIIEQTAKRLKRDFQQTLVRLQAGITADQWVVMDYLSKNESLNQLEIANYLSKDAPTLTRILDLLSEKNFILRKKAQNDRRKFIIELTPEGIERHQSLLPHVQEFRRQHFNGLSDQELSQLKLILQKINQNISS